MTWFASLCNPG